MGYVYLLTPKGIEQKLKLTLAFLTIKLKGYERLKKEIIKLQKDSKKL